MLKRRILSLKGLFIGIIAGLTAVGFRLSLEYAEKLRNTFLVFSRSHEVYYWPLPAYQPPLMPPWPECFL